MHTFKDDNGKEWKLHITIGSAKRIREKFDLLGERPETLIQDVAGSPLVQFDLIWEFCVNKEGCTEEEFEDGISGDSLKGAVKALWDEIIFFSQTVRPELAAVIPKFLEKYEKMSLMAVNAALEFMEGTELEDKMAEALTSTRDEVRMKLSTMSLDGSE